MRHRALLAAGLVCLAYLGLADGAAWSLGGLAEVPAVEADTLVGGATCPSYAQTTCTGATTNTRCKFSKGYTEGIRFSGTLSGDIFCGINSSCTGVIISTTATVCGS